MSLSNIPSLEAHIREPAMNGLEFFFVGFDQALPLGKKKKKNQNKKYQIPLEQYTNLEWWACMKEENWVILF